MGLVCALKQGLGKGILIEITHLLDQGIGSMSYSIQKMERVSQFHHGNGKRSKSGTLI